MGWDVYRHRHRLDWQPKTVFGISRLYPDFRKSKKEIEKNNNKHMILWFLQIRPKLYLEVVWCAIPVTSDFSLRVPCVGCNVTHNNVKSTVTELHHISRADSMQLQAEWYGGQHRQQQPEIYNLPCDLTVWLFGERDVALHFSCYWKAASRSYSVTDPYVVTKATNTDRLAVPVNKTTI